MKTYGVDNARGLRRRMTDVERRLWIHLRGGRLEGYKFRRQYPVGEYVVDFACVSSRLVVELDGGQHGEQQTYDDARTRFLQGQGYRVLRFWNNEMLDNLDAVLGVIREALARVAPHPNPLPNGERGPD